MEDNEIPAKVSEIIKHIPMEIPKERPNDLTKDISIESAKEITKGYEDEIDLDLVEPKTELSTVSMRRFRVL